jgi:hypothetical protein
LPVHHDDGKDFHSTQLKVASLHCRPGLQEELKASQRDVAALQQALAEARVGQLAGEAVTLGNGAVLLAAAVDGLDAKSLQARSSQPVSHFSSYKAMHCRAAICSGRYKRSLQRCAAASLLVPADAKHECTAGLYIAVQCWIQSMVTL